MALIWSSLLLTCTLMFGLWVWQKQTGNAAVVDVGWTLAVTLLHVGLALFGGGCWQKSLPLALMGLIWGLRLGGHLWERISAPEEGRYQKLREEHGEKTQTFLLFFFQMQAAAAVLLVSFYLPAYRDPGCAWNRLHWLGLLGFAVGLVGVHNADLSLRLFKASARQGVCQDGLWYYSRHPNYFFELVMWSSWSLYALSSPYGWLSLGAPLILAYLIVRVTGIPPAEAQALRSRGQEYADYQRTTSPLIPWLKRT